MYTHTSKINSHTDCSLHQGHHRAETSQADADEKKSILKSSTRNVIIQNQHPVMQEENSENTCQ